MSIFSVANVTVANHIYGYTRPLEGEYTQTFVNVIHINVTNCHHQFAIFTYFAIFTNQQQRMMCNKLVYKGIINQYIGVPN